MLKVLEPKVAFEVKPYLAIIYYGVKKPRTIKWQFFPNRKRPGFTAGLWWVPCCSSF